MGNVDERLYWQCEHCGCVMHNFEVDDSPITTCRRCDNPRDTDEDDTDDKDDDQPS